jgi:hypothetical protein
MAAETHALHRAATTLRLCFLKIWSINWSAYLVFVWPRIVNTNDVNNQQDSTTFSFINLFKSAGHFPGEKFAHPQEPFLTIYSFWYNALPLLPIGATVETELEFHLNCGTGRQQRRCILPKAVHTVKNYSWGWANLSPGTCRADL